MTSDERFRCVGMAEALLKEPRAIRGIAKARNWDANTIRSLALDPCLGLHGGKLVYLYPTGAKKRHRPLSAELAATFSGAPFEWMFGKPHSLWHHDRLLPCTERVHFTEGETAAISLVDAGIDNQTTEIVMAVPGANGWRDEWAPNFRGRSITIWPDADEPGQKMVPILIKSLTPFAKSIEVVPTKEASCL